MICNHLFVMYRYSCNYMIKLLLKLTIMVILNVITSQYYPIILDVNMITYI